MITWGGGSGQWGPKEQKSRFCSHLNIQRRRLLSEASDGHCAPAVCPALCSVEKTKKVCRDVCGCLYHIHPPLPPVPVSVVALCG